MQIRRVTTAEAPVGVITQIDEIFDPSTVETGIDVLDTWGFDKVPERHGAHPGRRRRQMVLTPLRAVTDKQPR
jgi:hypothetical protein